MCMQVSRFSYLRANRQFDLTYLVSLKAYSSSGQSHFSEVNVKYGLSLILLKKMFRNAQKNEQKFPGFKWGSEIIRNLVRFPISCRWLQSVTKDSP